MSADSEQERVEGILAGCRAARLTDAFSKKLIDDGVALHEAQQRILDEISKRGTGITIGCGLRLPKPPQWIKGNIGEALSEFLSGKRTGQIILDVHRGTVQSLEIRERTRRAEGDSGSAET